MDCRFLAKLGTCSIITGAELWGVYEGLSLAWDLGVRRFILDTDSECVVNLLTQNSGMARGFSHLLHMVRNLIQKPWQVRVAHRR